MIGLSHKGRIPPDPDQAALWWATLRQADPDRFAEDGRFDAWVAYPANADAWREYDRRIAAVGTFAALPEIMAMREAAVAAAQPRRARGPWLVTGGLLAASFLALAIWVDQPMALFAPDRTAATIAGAQPQRYASAVGERRDIVLADGSRIALNSGSTVEVDYSAAQRSIRLVAGQAFFQVAHNPARPFVVAAGDRMVTATGTAFDVRVEPGGRVTVVLVEGRVHVDPARPHGIARLIPAAARENLDPGESLVAAPAAEPVVAVTDIDRDTAWKRGVIIFRKDRLADAIEQINRYATTQLVIDDRRIDDLPVSGVFPTASQQDFVAAITAFYPIEARHQPGGTIALKWRTQTPFGAN